MIQTFFNSDGTGLTAIITVIVDGDHVDPDSWPITNDPAIVLSSHPAASKTVTAIDTGVFKVVWSSLSPALAHGDVVFIAVDGAISATAWTTWQIPVQVIHLPSTVTALAVVATDTGTTIPALIPTAGAIADQVWDEATAGHTTSGTYGGRVVRSTNSNVEVQITGSNHIAADVHEFQTGVITAAALAADAITAAALAADAVTEIQSGLASQASVDVIDGIVDTILVDTNDLQTNQGAWLTATGFATVNPDNAGIAAIQGKTDQLTFTVANQVDSNALTGGGGASAEDVRIEMDANSTKLADILEDTNELQTNQGNWLTATSVTVSDKTGFSIAGTINTLDELDTAQDTQHGTTRTAVNDEFTVIKGATWSGTTDTLEAIRDRGDVAWISDSDSSPGIGFYTIQLEIKLSNGTLVPECDCVLTTSNTDSSTDIHGHVRSSVNAIAEFDCDEGTYYLWRQKSGINFNNPRIVTVASNGDVTVTGA